MAQGSTSQLPGQPQVAMSTAIDPQAQDQAGTLEQLAPVVESSSVRPDAHTQRYDRQLRLWASSGQASLESANVLLVGATHIGAQVLKNLILPGIGSFTVLDGQKVTTLDIGNSFFVEPASKGKQRADEVARLLAELNPNVRSSSKASDPAGLISSDPEWFKQFSIIIAANQPPQLVRPLAQLAWQAHQGIGIPFLNVRGSGMIGELRTQIKEMGIIETHPASTVDLRLTSPWPELSLYAQSYNVSDTDSMAHSHIPFIVILLRKLQEWQDQHEGHLPTPAKDRKAFVDSINASRDSSNTDLENFDEAVAALGQNVWRPISAGRKVPTEVEELFRDPVSDNLMAKSSNFWLLVAALKTFVEASSLDSPSGGDGHLPLPGSLPDFKALSAIYIDLQRLYKRKATTDLEGFKGHLSRLLDSLALPTDVISDDEVESFVKHAAYLKLVRGRSLQEALNKPASEAVSLAFMDPVNPSTVQNHLAFLAIDDFYLAHHRYPGSSKAFSDHITGSTSVASSTLSTSSSVASVAAHTMAAQRMDAEPEKKRQRSGSPAPGSTPSRSATLSPSLSSIRDVDGDSRMRDGTSVDDGELNEASLVDVDADEVEALSYAKQVLKTWSIDEEEQVEAVLDATRELVRSGHCDLASTASLLGGVAAQEAIKLITRQYVPLEGVAIYDGIKQAIGTFRL